MAKIDDVAKLAGVSTATVSAVVNGQDIVKPKTRNRVLKAINTLNYQPNLYARSLARGRSAMLGIIISDIGNPFFAEIAQNVQTEALTRNYQCLISATEFSTERLRAAVQHMVGMRVDGLIVMTSEMDESVSESLRHRKIPVIFEDVGTADKTTANLRIDYEGGIRSAVAALVELGHKEILFAENHPASVEAEKWLSHRLRADAFRKAAKAFPGVHTHLIDCPGPAFQAGVEGARRALEQFHFTGVVVNSDPVAFGLMRGFREAGKQIPADISIVSFDDNPACEYVNPPLTSVSVSRQAIGSLAVKTLINMIAKKERGREIHIPTKLIFRGTHARPAETSVRANARASTGVSERHAPASGH